ncbi:MAG: DsrE/DsrF/DrsH-like family protein [Dehalococcoidia bacterium]
MTPSAEPAKSRAIIILHSGSYDRVSYAMSLATICLAMGMEAHILLTYGGLRRFVKGHLEDLEGTDSQLTGVFQRGLASGGIQSIEALVADARKLGLKIYACANAMANMSIARHELVEEVDQVMGLAAFVQLAENASVNWYI